MSGKKLKMFISNGNNHNSNLFALRSKAAAANAAPKPASTSLKNPMIGRIHNTTSGCGSCGGKKAY